MTLLPVPLCSFPDNPIFRTLRIFHSGPPALTHFIIHFCYHFLDSQQKSYVLSRLKCSSSSNFSSMLVALLFSTWINPTLLIWLLKKYIILFLFVSSSRCQFVFNYFQNYFSKLAYSCALTWPEFSARTWGCTAAQASPGSAWGPPGSH